MLPEVAGLRIDIMSVLHGCDSFEKLWARRTRVSLPHIGNVNLLSLPDLVQAKKTQRDKDWPMIQRLVESDYQKRASRPHRARIEFWLREARTPELLAELCKRYPAAARRISMNRDAVREALAGDSRAVEAGVRAEEALIRNADQAYWAPLRAELAKWRHNRRKGGND
jgi:hypothetical protein